MNWHCVIASEPELGEGLGRRELPGTPWSIDVPSGSGFCEKEDASVLCIVYGVGEVIYSKGADAQVL
jgi:hypothetical protein